MEELKSIIEALKRENEALADRLKVLREELDRYKNVKEAVREEMPGER